MKLGSVAKAKIRHVVGLLRSIQDENRSLYDRAKEKRELLAKLRTMHAAAVREAAEMSHPSAMYTTPAVRARTVQRCKDHVAECTQRVAEVEAEIAKLKASEDALVADNRAASAFAARIMREVDDDDGLLREELEWFEPGRGYPARRLPGVA